MEQEQEQNVDIANNKSVDWSEDVDLELSVGKDPRDTGSSSFDKTENSSGNIVELFEKTVKNPDIMDSIIQEEDLNQNLGTNLINSENKPLEVHQCLENISINNIVTALYAKIGDDLIAAKLHYKRKKWLYLEVIFTSQEKQQLYAALFSNKYF
ncbi:15428_t:CDS:2 [Gigaspora margarita]|uniref:15428_t:CDS:1 n=1 Tax=Gigaspora margarita TaxID=4874 RepID=A0ABN7WDM6_GIGMA|nr:15428_t:CDS:2 [Gigaspora margarita]